METTETRRCRNGWIFWCFLIICSYTGAAERKSKSVEITNLIVPHSIENGTLEFTLFDCEYRLKDNLTDLLVFSWVYNDHTIVYKWIPEHNTRIASGILKNRIDMTYGIQNVAPWQTYRALKVLKPTTELSGKYACDVSTKEGHATESSTLIVYTKPKQYELELSPGISQDQLNVSCWANGSNPEPKLSISYEVNRNRVKLTDVIEESSWIAGFYDVRISSLVNRNLLPTPTLFSCDVKIPNTSFLVRKDVAFADHRMSTTVESEDQPMRKDESEDAPQIMVDGTGGEPNESSKVEIWRKLLVPLFILTHYIIH